MAKRGLSTFDQLDYPSPAGLGLLVWLPREVHSNAESHRVEPAVNSLTKQTNYLRPNTRSRAQNKTSREKATICALLSDTQ